MLILGQVAGDTSCRALSLQDPHKRALVAAHRLASKDWNHVARAENSRADGLANLAMDTKVSTEWHTFDSNPIR